MTKNIFLACPLDHTRPLSALLLGLPSSFVPQTIFHHFLGMFRSSPIQVILPHATETPSPESSISPYHNTYKLPLTGYRSVFPLPVTITSLLFCHVLSTCVSLLSLLAGTVLLQKLLHATKKLPITTLINILKTYANSCQRFLKEKWSVYIE